MIEIKKIIKNKNYCCDSRIVKKNDIFFDLSSSKNKSGKYLNEALKKNPLRSSLKIFNSKIILSI